MVGIFINCPSIITAIKSDVYDIAWRASYLYSTVMKLNNLVCHKVPPQNGSLFWSPLVSRAAFLNDAASTSGTFGCFPANNSAIVRI